MAYKHHQIASSVKANYLALDRLTEFGSSITLGSVRVQPRRTGLTSLYCNRLSPRFMWLDPPPYGLPHRSGPNICDELTRFTGRGSKTRRCGCVRRSALGKMTREFCASRGAAAQRFRGAVSCCHVCHMAPGKMNEGSPTGRALA